MEEEEEEDVFSRLSIRSSICLIIFNRIAKVREAAAYMVLRPGMCSLTHTNDLLAHLIIRPTRHTSSSLCAVLACDFLRRSQQKVVLRASVMSHKQGKTVCLCLAASKNQIILLKS